jgi:hypothetical protein
VAGTAVIRRGGGRAVVRYLDCQGCFGDNAGAFEVVLTTA